MSASVPYAYVERMENGTVVSIDNLIVDYVLTSFNADRVFDSLASVFRKGLSFWEFETQHKRDLPACTKYQFFKHTIWGGGFHLSFGQYRSFDPVDRSELVYPVLRLKFNPNKYLNSPLFPLLRSWLAEWCVDGVIRKFDICADLPCFLDDVIVRSRREPGLFKGTRYYGQRHQHGYMKVYDKGKELRDHKIDISSDPVMLTRVEYTLMDDQPLPKDEVVWLTRGPEPLPDVGDLSPQCVALVKLLRDLRASGGDVLRGLEYLDRRTRKKIEPYTIGSGVQPFCLCSDVVDRLLGFYCVDLSVSRFSEGVKAVAVDDLEAGDQLPSFSVDVAPRWDQMEIGHGLDDIPLDI